MCFFLKGSAYNQPVSDTKPMVTLGLGIYAPVLTALCMEHQAEYQRPAQTDSLIPPDMICYKK